MSIDCWGTLTESFDRVHRLVWLDLKVVLLGFEVPPLLIPVVAVHYITTSSGWGVLSAHPCQNLLGFCVCFSSNSYSD